MRILISLIKISLLVLLCGFAGCAPKQRIMQKEQSDTSITQNVHVGLRDTQVYNSRIVKDTNIVVPARKVADTVDASKPGASIKRQNGATIITNVLPDGRMAVQAECDSIMYTLLGQIEELYYRHSVHNDSFDGTTTFIAHKEEVQELKRKKDRLILLLVAGVLLFSIIFVVFRKFIL